jgi:hypothetical protein
MYVLPTSAENRILIILGADGPDKGIIPLTCMELFERVDKKRAADSAIQFIVEVSYIEIYNEKVCFYNLKETQAQANHCHTRSETSSTRRTPATSACASIPLSARTSRTCPSSS